MLLLLWRWRWMWCLRLLWRGRHVLWRRRWMRGLSLLGRGYMLRLNVRRVGVVLGLRRRWEGVILRRMLRHTRWLAALRFGWPLRFASFLFAGRFGMR